MQQYFYNLSEAVFKKLTGDEKAYCNISAEDSDFCRFNHNRIKQVGNVSQKIFSVTLINGQRSTQAIFMLTGQMEEDADQVKKTLSELRDKIACVPEDPHLLYATEVNSSEYKRVNQLCSSKQMIGDILEAGIQQDLVGFLATGAMYHGFANWLGQRNWYENHCFNFDWSLYLHSDKAVKCAYAGFAWETTTLLGKMDDARKQTEILNREPRTIVPGKYRVYLAPAALQEILSVICGGGFGAKFLKTRQSPLLKLADGEVKLHEDFTLSESISTGIAPDFNYTGFTLPATIKLVEKGQFQNCLVSPRSAKEYGIATNSGSEVPGSLDMAAGNIAHDDILKNLETGVFINNLWYLNYSDRMACRITGMTRFASFWVESGKIIAPINVMRFDECAFQMFGPNLVGLTQERDMLLDPHTYSRRTTASTTLPGALVEDFTFTL